MLAVFALNAYIGTKDTGLAQLQPSHEMANSFMAFLDLVSASLLLAIGRGRVRWVLLSGVVWPVVYLLSLVADIESRMCLFTGTNCFASVADSYQFLILGSIAEGWKIWRYTIPCAIALLTATILLSAIFCIVNWPRQGTKTLRESETVASGPGR
jgi:peptidoglycan/LPS O-acetylase OafA/YrhL